MTREESDALDLKIIDFEKRREEELAKRAALEELVINESDPTETAKTLAVLFTRRDDFLSKGSGRALSPLRQGPREQPRRTASNHPAGS